MKVLILDDFFYRVSRFSDRFKAYGITDITHVTTAEQCIDSISKGKYTVIFLDYHLDGSEFMVKDPSNTGIRVAEWIRDKYDRAKETEIIIHTGSEFGAHEMKNILPNAYIIKNAWNREGFNKVVRILGLNKASAEKQGGQHVY
jgi:CheY-like chemotaxis protein